MGARFVMWPRRHSIARVHKAGDWMALGAIGPAVTPFEDRPRIENDLPMGPDNTLPEAPPARPSPVRAVELEHAVRSCADAARGRGRPRKVAAR